MVVKLSVVAQPDLDKKNDDGFPGLRVRVLRRRDRNLSAPEKIPGPLDRPVEVLVAVRHRPGVPLHLYGPFKYIHYHLLMVIYLFHRNKSASWS
jgi:hypothetical protein